MPVQPVQVIYQTLKMFNTEVQLSDIEMQFIVDDSYIAMDAGIVMLDSSRLRQVIVNLVTNAIKFTKTETRQRSITLCISAHAEPPAIGPKGFRYFPTEKNYTDVTISEEWGQGSVIYLRVEVADSGCGLTEEEKKNLFTRYSQASPKTHVKYGGSGLGLFISRQLTELQGGEIGVASEAGVGSTFAFYIKVRRAVGQDAHVAHETLHPGLQVLNAPHKPSASRVSSAPASLTTIASLEENSPSHWHVLIVEDNLVNQKVLAKGIKKLGCTVHVANHGGEALELLQDTKHYVGQEKSGKDLTVILMDLEMPVMDGLTCVRKIRQLEKEGLLMTHLPVIAVTANARGEQVLAAKESGMVSPSFDDGHQKLMDLLQDDVMPKPFQIRDLVPKIEALLIPRRSQRT
jgi:CheY-like chemotaxis protein